MMKPANKRPQHLQIVPALRRHESILANLLMLYMHDFSEFCEIPISADGRFIYKGLSRYWNDPNRRTFLIKIDNELAGLVMLRRRCDTSDKKAYWEMTEFFVLRGYRRQGIGTVAVHEIWKQFTGQWKVYVMDSNKAACRFWTVAITRFTGKTIRAFHIEKDGKGWQLFSFEAEGAKSKNKFVN